MESSTHTPLWVTGWIGFVASMPFVGGIREALPGARLAVSPGIESPGAGSGEAGERPLGVPWIAWGPRELRLLPGIGAARARAIAEERWRRGPGNRDFDLRELRGIGDRTHGSVIQFLRGWGNPRGRGVDGGPGPGVVHFSPRLPHGSASTDG